MPASNTSILIIDEKLGNYSAFRQQYQSSYAFEVASSIERALLMITSIRPNLVVLGLHENGKTSVSQLFTVFLPRIKKLLKEKCPLIILSSYSLASWDKKMQEQGVILHEYNFAVAEELHEILQQALANFSNNSKASTEKTGKQQQNSTEDNDLFFSASPQMLEVKKALRKLAEYPKTPVLILGETGVGKEVACRYLHQSKQKAQELSFEAINLSIYSEELLFSEIFGHKKGSFTGADQDKVGAFENARNGTLFLDEIGDISPKAQVALLRVIQERVFRRVGDLEDKTLTAQLVFATNKNLEEEIAKHNFREDLYHRIQSYTIHIPPLRERVEEIPAFIDRFWADFCTNPNHLLYGQRGREVFTASALDIMCQYPWSGNVRELQAVVQKMVIDTDMRSKLVVDPSILPARFFHTKEIPVSKVEPATPEAISEKDAEVEHQAVPTTISKDWPLSKRTAFNELTEFEKALKKWGGRRSDAAKELGLANDQNLRYNVLKYYKKHPEIFNNFPIICLLYKLDK